MALTQSDRAEIKLLAIEAAKEITREVIKNHIDRCPHGKALNRGKAFIAGVAFAFGLLGMGVGGVLVKMVK